MNRAKARRTRHEPGHTDVFGPEQSKRRINLRLVMTLAVILLVAGGIIGLSVAVPDKPAAPAVGTPGFGRSIQSPALNSGIRNPRPNQYDPLTDRYWHVQAGGNAHWHNGRPPADAGTVTPGFNPTTSTSTIVDPQPNQYDPLTDRYWHVQAGGNGHWHNGRPPAEGDR